VRGEAYGSGKIADSTAGYLTSYDGLVCDTCADGRPVSPVTLADLEGVYGYDTARCEECGRILFDGLRRADGFFGG
jgi:hypothetical protein